MAQKIAPISGFPEYLPAQQLAFNTITNKIKAVYESFGYVPLETPAVERIDILTSKGIDSKEVYALRRLNVAEGDDGAKELALRFDLTVPLARYVAQHYANLQFPFRRYQCQPVWRGERPKKGRERQFHQFDLDILTDGQGSLPLAADAEVIAAAHQALTAILPTGTKFKMRVNNRKLLQAICAKFGYESYAAIKIIDNLEKIPHAEAISQLKELNTSSDAEGFLNKLKSPTLDTSIEGAEELQQVITMARSLVANPESITIDITIARGLDYYTGTVIETNIIGAEDFGSICSGGRYENLCESLSERNLPGVGVSIGITRLCEWLFTQEAYQNPSSSTAHALVICLEGQLEQATQTAGILRKLGLNIEQTLAPQDKIKQLQRAEKRGLQHAILIESDSTLTLRHLPTRKDNPSLTPEAIAKILHE